MLRSADSARKLSFKNTGKDVDKLLNRIDTAVYCAAKAGKCEAEFSPAGIEPDALFIAKIHILSKGYTLQKMVSNNPLIPYYYKVSW